MDCEDGKQSFLRQKRERLHTSTVLPTTLMYRVVCSDSCGITHDSQIAGSGSDRNHHCDNFRYSF